MLQIQEAGTLAEIKIIQALFREYQAELGISLGFQRFDEELETLPGRYAPPGGRLWLAREDDSWIGCVALRPLDDEVCELKRLFVRPEARGLGAGRQLVNTAIQFARTFGYRAIRLDTLPQMDAAAKMYEQIGFRPIAPYTQNPVVGARFLEMRME